MSGLRVFVALTVPAVAVDIEIQECPFFQSPFPSADGACNHKGDELAGAAGHIAPRFGVNSGGSFPIDFSDGTDEPNASGRPLVRAVSNAMCNQDSGPSGVNLKEGSALMIYFGQFVDHDVALIPETLPEEHFNIPVPEDDPVFSGEMEFARSSFVRSVGGYRDFTNILTAWLDLSGVYGDTFERAQALRKHEDGLLLSSFHGDAEFLPRNRDLPGGPIQVSGSDMDPGAFACGDPRCNENTALLTLNQLFLREHNRLARSLAGQGSDEEIYQRARLRNILQYQKIVYEEYLPALFGRANMRDPSFNRPYGDYSESVDPNTDLLFSTCAYRYGHSGIPETIKLAAADHSASGEFELADVFFRSATLTGASTMDLILNGLRLQQHEELDMRVVDALRQNLFRNNGEELDLISLNMQRARDHGIPGFGAFWNCPGNSRSCFSELTGEQEEAAALEEMYGGDFGALDPFVAGMGERKEKDSALGVTFSKVIMEQFLRYRDADRFFYLRVARERPEYSDILRDEILLTDIIDRNCPLSLSGRVPSFLTSPFFVSQMGSSSLRVEWTGRYADYSVINAQAYVLGHRQLPGGQEQRSTVAADVKDYLFQDLQPNTPYLFTLYEVNQQGDLIPLFERRVVSWPTELVRKPWTPEVVGPMQPAGTYQDDVTGQAFDLSSLFGLPTVHQELPDPAEYFAAQEENGQQMVLEGIEVSTPEGIEVEEVNVSDPEEIPEVHPGALAKLPGVGSLFRR